ncbi:hematopoietic progenitor cell antigen CD34 isoform X2 [Acanthochromis polyacanthus]|uniref:hematopoietic progenitor cell antigen CD34 isoform X2 n=1 Tax=Acanthochromis polyacanthus TaxID=80966 RepID=UPI000B9088F3|nr:hematopoietic progenitor cell antigen CD34 isoform X2 [Acanthochromis polyacanthus]
MAASSAQSTHRPYKMLAFALLLIASLFSAGVMAQEDEVVAVTVPLVDAYVRGDMIPVTTKAPEPTEETTAATATEAAGNNEDGGPATDEGTDVNIQTEKPEIMEPETPAMIPSRGDGPADTPQPVPAQEDVICVKKEAVQDKNAVNLKLKATSNCEDTKVKIISVLQELCGEDCKLEIYQENNSDEILVSGKYVEDDVAGMANKFNNDNIKDKTDVKEAVPRWGRNSKLVLVSLLLTGLLLAALLVAGYYFKTHRKNSKGVRLAESFQVDEENQANTLVSVAPLPQEPLDKPTVNGESPPENGTTPTPTPTTNGHSATQTPVADTEM